jgi:hypothetical protein
VGPAGWVNMWVGLAALTPPMAQEGFLLAAAAAEALTGKELVGLSILYHWQGPHGWPGVRARWPGPARDGLPCCRVLARGPLHLGVGCWRGRRGIVVRRALALRQAPQWGSG